MNFCRQENCYRCFYVYLSVPDCCATGWECSAERGWRDNKVQPPQSRHFDIQTIGVRGCSLMDFRPGSLRTRLKYFCQPLARYFSHLMGMFYRTIRMLEHGIKPVYVFDGKPPHLKSGEVSMGSDFLSCFSPCILSL